MKKLIFKILDNIGGCIVWVMGIIAMAVAGLSGAALVALGIAISCAVPILALVAAWAILVHMGVL
jgi:hypothetical protein